MTFIRDYLQKIEKRIKGPRLFIQVLGAIMKNSINEIK